MWPFRPNLEKLASRGDVTGLVRCVLGKDAAVAARASPLLASLLDRRNVGSDIDGAITVLERNGSGALTDTLAAVIRIDLGVDKQVKSLAARALYRAGARDDLESILSDILASGDRGGALHLGLSRDLIDAATEASDIDFAEFLLRHGQFQMASEVESGFDLIVATRGDEGVRGILESVPYSVVSFERARSRLGVDPDDPDQGSGVWRRRWRERWGES